MTAHANPANHARAGLCLLLAATALLGLAGCASEAALQPPSLHLPTVVQHLAAERFGDTVELRWTTPARTTDGVSLAGPHGRGPFAAEICRSAVALPPGPCSPLATMAAEPGKPASFRDVLLPPWSVGTVRMLHYRVRILNVRGRGADGADVVVAAGLALPPVAALRATPAAGGGVVLRWQPLSNAPSDRLLLHVVRGTAERPVTLAVEATANDPGGATDAGARAGILQAYTIFRTRTVSVEKQTLTLNSAPATVIVAANAVPPPPAAPTGLEGVVNTLGTPEIDLVWQASEEPGVVGYMIYRSEAGAAPVAITPQPVHASSFSDTAVRPGTRYRYRVAAVNGNGAAGAMSAEIERVVPAP